MCLENRMMSIKAPAIQPSYRRPLLYPEQTFAPWPALDLLTVPPHTRDNFIIMHAWQLTA